MTEQQAMRLALEALSDFDYDKRMSAITALRQALDQQPAEHITDGSPCWCEPKTNYTDPETGASVIVHREPQ